MLEANVDGFRCDYAHGVPSDFWQQAIDSLRNIEGRDIIMFAETEEKELAEAGFDMIFGWYFYTYLNKIYDGDQASSLFERHRTEYATLENNKHIVRWTTNHDESAWNTTPQAAFGSQNAAFGAFVVTACMGGVPLIYNGQEVGVSDQIPFFEGNNYTINWNQNAEIKSQYTKLLNFRNQSEIIRKKALTDLSNNDIICFYKYTDNDYVLVVVNTRNSDSSIELPEIITSKTWQNAFNSKEISVNQTLSLAAYEYLVLKTN